jgi:hypothetical protein
MLAVAECVIEAAMIEEYEVSTEVIQGLRPFLNLKAWPSYFGEIAVRIHFPEANCVETVVQPSSTCLRTDQIGGSP